MDTVLILAYARLREACSGALTGMYYIKQAFVDNQWVDLEDDGSSPTELEQCEALKTLAEEKNDQWLMEVIDMRLKGLSK